MFYTLSSTSLSPRASDDQVKLMCTSNHVPIAFECAAACLGLLGGDFAYFLSIPQGRCQNLHTEAV